MGLWGNEMVRVRWDRESEDIGQERKEVLYRGVRSWRMEGLVTGSNCGVGLAELLPRPKI